MSFVYRIWIRNVFLYCVCLDLEYNMFRQIVLDINHIVYINIRVLYIESYEYMRCTSIVPQEIV